MGEHPFADVTVDDIGFVTASPGGDAVYAMTGAIASNGIRIESGSSLLAFARDPADGSLSQFAAEAGCDTTLPLGGGEVCQNNALIAVGAPVASTEIPDPKHLYVPSSNPNRVLVYKLNPAGSLATPQSCVADELAPNCVVVGGMGGIGAIALAVAPDGSQVYTGTGLATRAFNRAAETGALTPVAVDGCWAVGVIADPPCARGPAPDAQALAATALGGDVIGVSTGPFFGGDNGLVVYDRDVAAPVCDDGARSIGHNETVVLAIPCRDGDGDDDAVTVEIESAPASGGTLSAVDQATRSVSFFPAAGFSGQATFSYRATASGVTTAPKTFTVDVAAAPPPPPPEPTPQPPAPTPTPPPGPTGPLRIESTISSRFDAARAFTRTRRLVLSGVPASASVKVTCKPKRRDKRSCPFKTKTFRPSRTGTVVLTKSFSKRRLAVGTTLEIRITAPGAIGKVFVLKVRRARVPSQTTSCLPVGSAKPQRRC